MLYLLNKDVRTVRWNGEPLHEATSAIVKETMNGDFTLTVKYPISDSGIYQLIQEDMLIKAPTPVLGAQLFRIKKPVEYNDHLEITAYHISDDVMQRSITPVSVTSQSCGMTLSRMVQNTKTALGDFSFNSDIQDRRTFNTTETETLYSILLDGKHSIVGTWEGELVRDNFAMTVKKSRGENRGVVITTHKNLKNYQRTKNSQNVVTRIHAKSTFKPEGAEKETTIRVTVDSPLINSYPYINEKEYENNNAKTVEELQKWAQSKFSNEGIDKVSDAIKIEAYELDGQVVHMGDTVNLKSWKHNVDAFKKAIAYEFDALKEEYISLTFDDKAGIGGSRASGGLSSAADAILGVTESAQEIALEKALQNADLDFDHKAGLLRQEISDDIELAKARAEEVKRELSDTINQRFNSFDNGSLKEAKRKAEEALRNAGASSSLAQESKRIGLDSVARLEAFKSQTTSAQTALSGDLDALKRTIANDIRPKQAQAEAEIAKQVEALSRTKNELAGVKSAQATYKETTTRRLSELTNLANGKASKSELTQTAEELSSKIASVQASGRNLFLNSLFKQDIPKTGIWTTSTYTATIDSESKYLGHKALKIIGLNPSGRDGGNPKVTYPALGQFGKVIPGSTTNQDVTISFYAKANKNGIMLRSRLGNIGYKTGNVTLSTEIKRYAVHIPKGWTNESKRTTNEWLFNFNQEGTVWIWMPKFEISDVDTSYSEAPEDIEGQISTVESTFKQRANSLEAGVSRLTEGLRTKADISALNVTAENIRQSVKRLETDTQNKLNQKLSQAEFEVRAGSIRQEILNATKDKADKTLVVSEAGKLREEFSKMKVGGRNLWIKSKTVGAVIEKLPENHVTGQKECYRLENNSTLTFNLEPDFSSRLYQKVTFSAWIKYENVVQGRNFWNVFNCFKHYLFRKNSETGVQSGPDYDTLGRYKGSADWKYITFTYDYSEKTNFDQLKTSLRFNLEGATSGTAWVTGIKVEIGSVATDWSPAPEDGENELLVAKTEFKRTADGLSTKMAAVESYVGQDGQRQEALQRYTREESTRQATAVRELVNRDFVGKVTYQEDVKGINQRIEAVKTSANKDIASQIASYRQSVDGKFTDISSQITTYKQDVGGQISGLSNRLTSSEQGATTQISNISNRINSNKQGTDNQISNLKTQVATNKDNAERQMGRISDQVSANKANADSQFANVTNQLARKVETTDFQRVKETSKLYERILGNTENGIADKVARMALTNQLFQVEVGKYSVSGPNLIKNSDFKNGTNEWGSTQNLGRLVKHSFYHNGQKDLMRLSNATKNENFLYSHRFNLERNTDYVLNFRGFNNSALASYDVYIFGRRAGESDGFTIVKKVVSSKKLSTSRCEDVSVTFNSGEMDNAYIRFDNNGSSSGTADLYITEVDVQRL
ncbi:phage hyaluronidase [Streptococcus pneumoniae]|nr:phage hyaluronidase [Streptococcus pneumoniae]VSV62031.1 phage hyaluronidase [Streptococcus pneumoniae]